MQKYHGLDLALSIINRLAHGQHNIIKPNIVLFYSKAFTLCKAIFYTLLNMARQLSKSFLGVPGRFWKGMIMFIIMLLTPLHAPRHALLIHIQITLAIHYPNYFLI